MEIKWEEAKPFDFINVILRKKRIKPTDITSFDKFSPYIALNFFSCHHVLFYISDFLSEIDLSKIPKKTIFYLLYELVGTGYEKVWIEYKGSKKRSDTDDEIERLMSEFSVSKGGAKSILKLIELKEK